MGSSNNTVELSGKAMYEKEIVCTPFSHAVYMYIETIASSLYRRYKLGAHLAIEKGDQQVLKLKGGILWAHMFWLHRCLCLYAMAWTNKTKKKQYMAQVKCVHKELVNTLKNKNPNILHHISLLSAEKAVLKQKKYQKDDVRKLYNNVISMSAQGGY
eukprot:13235051-Ditylum_brightwellii.AAC.1